ncbi:hypothetical protein [Phyllobacterium endophyticum]|jgi:hypothetical protein|uniref:Uncharacterized protein n=1 Tax=Phyllobacterium endophyticum TaxID=1149773 RepID=A0A2P7B0Y9_9HYPH|nr:hypothetical protein [Phyllobacterium endophyticum]MBB3237678.1 hypothetical protein [Phyllobacterium endophyticum]PSH60138.1 hypothetical protein CU100_05385 [Phyllobacterium endophyticum]TXR48594.1 hypothetical protein FVA77_13190 [Phyllobacterium endophyticum]TYR42305.1 hypothetical protein FY050_13955 [Phyllobacterium endophyticum]
MNKKARTLEILKTELSKLCTLADDEGFEMIAYFIETAIRESDEQLSQETRAVVGMELRLASSGPGHP